MTRSHYSTLAQDKNICVSRGDAGTLAKISIGSKNYAEKKALLLMVVEGIISEHRLVLSASYDQDRVTNSRLDYMVGTE